MIVDTDAIVLHSLNFRDTSKIVTLYSRKYGKIKVVAKGARNQKTNKFGSSLEPMTHSSVVIYKKENKDLHLLSKSEIVTPLNRMQDNTEKMFTGLALVELVNMVIHDEEENDQLFTLLLEALKTIDQSERNGINVLLSFFAKIFHQFGFGISVESCSQCSRLTEKNDFPFVLLRLSDGKFTCSLCSQEQSTSGVKISGGMLRSLYYLQMNPIEKSLTLSLQSSVKDDLLATMQSYLRYHIEGVRTLKSLSLLQSMSMK